MEIPYERQIQRPGCRCCGAAALAMVYRSFGFEADQSAIWNELQAMNGSVETLRNRARSVDLTRHALQAKIPSNSRSLSAIPVRLADPWAALQGFASIMEGGIRLILNIRTSIDSASGHYSVCSGFDVNRQTVLLHDPQLGPNRPVSREELLELWTPFVKIPRSQNEISGNIALLFAKRESRQHDAICSGCNRPFELKFFRDILFLKNLYNPFARIFCPYCDHVFV